MSRAPLILVAEDNEANRDVISRRLRRRGFLVDAVCDGRQAVDRLAQDLPDIVLMDLEMPVMSGFDAIAAIRADARMTSLPVVALTAHATEDIRQKCIDAGFDGFVTKPLDFKALLAVIAGFGVATSGTAPQQGGCPV